MPFLKIDCMPFTFFRLTSVEQRPRGSIRALYEGWSYFVTWILFLNYLRLVLMPVYAQMFQKLINKINIQINIKISILCIYDLVFWLYGACIPTYNMVIFAWNFIYSDYTNKIFDFLKGWMVVLYSGSQPVVLKFFRYFMGHVIRYVKRAVMRRAPVSM